MKIKNRLKTINLEKKLQEAEEDITSEIMGYDPDFLVNSDRDDTFAELFNWSSLKLPYLDVDSIKIVLDDEEIIVRNRDKFASRMSSLVSSNALTDSFFIVFRVKANRRIIKEGKVNLDGMNGDLKFINNRYVIHYSGWQKKKSDIAEIIEEDITLLKTEFSNLLTDLDDLNMSIANFILITLDKRQSSIEGHEDYRESIHDAEVYYGIPLWKVPLDIPEKPDFFYKPTPADVYDEEPFLKDDEYNSILNLLEYVAGHFEINDKCDRDLTTEDFVNYFAVQLHVYS